MSEPVKPRRAYSSERRRAGALETRRRILDAAASLFVRGGYAGTSIAAIAAEAGTAAETVYATFGSKIALLEALVRGAARGADEGEILDQAGPRAVEAAPDQREQLRLFAADIVVRLARTGPLIAVLGAAARSEPALAELQRTIHDARLRNLEAFAAQLARTGPLRVPGDDAAETVWALASPELYTLLTGDRGWSARRYAAWLEDTLAVALLGQ